ncbi:flagellar basal body L-ring protein FlgH [Aestuariibacter sp. AA17]|uniref:Flagellar basal body L-ring protein FlgH n=1 Tax=Fluctibacter corallii TaxID=2984329 RepID=A0ABT3A9P2_9ALTE|nr:flagellar basal body L-ring protein FlgH [Aestuariibacter sp. AA17]MCV2885320.1 flagellar basal body L-ring protein FlgH [Aestuariibacter sp. AA17]
MWANKLRCIGLVFSCLFTVTTLADDLVNIDDFRPLTADKNAIRVGDIVTLLIFEDARAGSSANLQDSSRFDISAGASRDSLGWNYGLGIGADNDGDAATERKGFIRAYITVQVLHVDQHGLLNVKGSQKLKINDEEQIILVEGKLRHTDIAANNTALSSRLLDAKISFTGEGTVSDGHDSGVINSLLRWLGII